MRAVDSKDLVKVGMADLDATRIRMQVGPHTRVDVGNRFTDQLPYTAKSSEGDPMS